MEVIKPKRIRPRTLLRVNDLQGHDLFNVVTKFLSKIKTTDVLDDCWLWAGGRDKNGYGMFWAMDKFSRAHRAIWEMIHGDIPDGMAVCHKCDNPPCVNPAHLFTGTALDNHRDCINKGRRACTSGEYSYRAILNWEKVDEIRRLSSTGVPGKEIANQLNLKYPTVIGVIAQKTWKPGIAKRKL